MNAVNKPQSYEQYWWHCHEQKPQIPSQHITIVADFSNIIYTYHYFEMRRQELLLDLPLDLVF